MQFTKEEFLKQYQNLFQSQDKLIRDEANVQILMITKSDSAWSIAQQLICEQQSGEIHFIACQLLYRKTKESFSELRETAQNELKHFLQQLLIGNINISNLALKQVCCAWASIILQDQQQWNICLQDLVILMQSGKKQMETGLEIMTQIANETKEIYGKQKQTQIQLSFLAQKSQLIEIFQSLLQLTDISLLEQSINCLDSWIEFGLQCLDNFTFTKQILELTYNSLISENYQIFSKLCSILTNLIKFSSKKHLVQNEASIQDLIKNLNTDEQQSLQSIQLLINKQALDLSIRNLPSRQISLDVWRAFAEFSGRFCSDFLILVLLDQDPQVMLAEVMLMIADHPSRGVAQLTFEFWIDFRSQLNKRKLELQQLNIDINRFYRLFQRLLQPILNKCQLKTTKISQKFIGGVTSRVIDLENQCQEITILQENDEQADQNEVAQGALNPYDFREYAKDIIYCIYQSDRDSGPFFFTLVKINLDIYQKILERGGNITKSEFDSFITRTEAALFAAQTVLDDFVCDVDQVCITEIVEFVLLLQKNIENVTPKEILYPGWMNIIVKTSLQLFYEFSQQTGFSKQTFYEIIGYILIYVPHPQLGPLASQALESISQISKLPIEKDLVEKILNFYQQYCSIFFSYTHVENFVSGMMNIIWNIDEQKFSTFNQSSFSQVGIIAQSNFQQFLTLQNPDKSQLSNAINNLLSILNWFSLHQEEIIKTPLIQIPQQMTSIIINPLITLLSSSQSTNDQLNQALRLFRIILKICDYNTQFNGINDILTLALNQVASDPIKKAQWLNLVSMAIYRSDRKSQNQHIFLWLKSNLTNLNQFCLQQHIIWQDPDLVRYWVELLKHVINYDVQLFLSLPDYFTVQECLIKALLDINSYEMQREVLFYIKDLVIHSPKEDQTYQKSIPYLIVQLFQALPQLNPALITQFQQIIVHVNYQVSDKTALFNLIQQGVQQSFSCTPQQLTIICKAIITLASITERGQINRDLKLILTNIRPQYQDEINYMQLELQTKKILNLNKNIKI